VINPLTLNGTGAGTAGQDGALVSSGSNLYMGPITLGSAATISSDSGTLTLGNTGALASAARSDPRRRRRGYLRWRSRRDDGIAHQDRERDMDAGRRGQHLWRSHNGKQWRSRAESLEWRRCWAAAPVSPWFSATGTNGASSTNGTLNVIGRRVGRANQSLSGSCSPQAQAIPLRSIRMADPAPR